MLEYNKRTTLKDIGMLLDRFIVDEKASNLKFGMQVQREDKLKYPGKDQSSWNMSLFGAIMEEKSPLRPHVLDDHSALDSVVEGEDN
jgi:hypothetical protein